MNKKRFWVMVGVISLALVVMAVPFMTACAAPAEEEEAGKVYTWRHQCAYGTADCEYITLEPFHKAIDEKTGGRLKITPFPGETIVPTEELLTSTAEGVVEVCHAAGGYWKGIVPIANIEQGLPYFWRGHGSLDTWKELLYGQGLDELFREAYAKQGVYYVGSHSYDSYPIVVSAVPIRTLADYEGLKIRASGAPSDMFDHFGASVTWMPGAELYMALKLGTMDAVTWSCEGLIGYKWYEVADYLIRPEMLDHSNSHFLVDTDAWNALPEDIQQVYMDCYHDIYIPQLYAMYMAEWKMIYTMEGILPYEIITLPDEDVAKMQKFAIEEMWDKEAEKGADCAEAVQIAKDFYGIK